MLRKYIFTIIEQYSVELENGKSNERVKRANSEFFAIFCDR